MSLLSPQAGSRAAANCLEIAYFALGAVVGCSYDECMKALDANQLEILQRVRAGL